MQCDKVTYSSQQEALDEIKRLHKIPKSRSVFSAKQKPNSAYKCRLCGWWHITTEGKKGHPSKSERLILRPRKKIKYVYLNVANPCHIKFK